MSESKNLLFSAAIAMGETALRLPAGATVLGVTPVPATETLWREDEEGAQSTSVLTTEADLFLLYTGRPGVPVEERRVVVVVEGEALPDVGGWRLLGCFFLRDRLVAVWLDPVVRPVEKEG